jgi:hypothetical protein
MIMTTHSRCHKQEKTKMASKLSSMSHKPHLYMQNPGLFSFKKLNEGVCRKISGAQMWEERNHT